MRIILSIAVLIIALSIGYYFVYYLPHKDQEQQQMQQQQAQQSQDFTKQKECMALGEKYYTQDKADNPGWIYETPNYHYNQKLNTCLYSVSKSLPFDEKWKCAGYIEAVTDLLSNNVILSITQNAPTCQTTMNRDAFDKQYKVLFTE